MGRAITEDQKARARARARAHYWANRERHKEMTKRYREEHREECNRRFLAYYHAVGKFSPKRIASVKKSLAARHARFREKIARLKDVPCLDCGGRFPPECMDFDHVRGGPALDEEIAKCDVVCANCHRIRTMSRRRKKQAPEAARIEALG